MNIRQELRKWAYGMEWDVSATLTFADDINPSTAQETIRHFWNRVDRALYGNAAKRFKKRCQRLMFIEGSEHGVRYHYHAAVRMPVDRYWDVEDFCRFLRKQWRCACAHNHIVEFKPISDRSGWIRYITKSVERGDCDTFDVNTSHIAITNLLNERV